MRDRIPESGTESGTGRIWSRYRVMPLPATPSKPRRPKPLGRIRDRRRPDPAGLVLGTVFFILALTPSLLPRDVLSQGAPCGLCAGTGYPLGVRLSWNWRT